MIKTFMIIWATMYADDGTITASGLTSTITTQEECNQVKAKIGKNVDILCIPLVSKPVIAKTEAKAKEVKVLVKAEVPMPKQKPPQKKKPYIIKVKE